MKIIIDNRERIHANPHPGYLQSQGVEIEWRNLPVGDYATENLGFVVERKAPGDFVQSVIDRRLFTQVKAAADTGTKMVFLIEGDPFKTERMSCEAIAGALSYLPAIEGVPVVMAQTPRDACVLMHTLLRHATEGLGYDVNLQPPKPKSIPDQKLHILSAFPGIGEGTARALIAHFGSLRAVLGASESELLQVKGVGKTMVGKIQAVLSA